MFKYEFNAYLTITIYFPSINRGSRQSPYNPTMSLRASVFNFLDNNDVTDVKAVYKKFPDSNKNTVERYYYIYKKLNATDISLDIELENIDTIQWMERTIQRIKDPVKLAENISRLHSMKLKPLANKQQKSLKELFDAS